MRRPKPPIRIRCVCFGGVGNSKLYMYLAHRALTGRKPRGKERITFRGPYSELKPRVIIEQRQPHRRTIELTRHGISKEIMRKEARERLLTTQHLEDASAVIVFGRGGLLSKHRTLEGDTDYQRQVQRLKRDKRIIEVPLSSPLHSLGEKLKDSSNLSYRLPRMTKEEAEAFREFRRQLIEKISK